MVNLRPGRARHDAITDTAAAARDSLANLNAVASEIETTLGTVRSAALAHVGAMDHVRGAALWVGAAAVVASFLAAYVLVRELWTE